LAQIMPEEADNQVIRLESLALIDTPEATRQLARAAVFSPHKDVRAVAILALGDRPTKDSTAVLVGGLRYPWPAVAENAARAIVALKRKDLIPELEAVLKEPDPRAPREAKVGGRKATVAREVVRINHHRSCVLCHAPVEKGKEPKDVLVAQVPLPSEPLPGGGGYGGTNREQPKTGLLVRIDVTYLRQDFSVVLPVYDSSAWRVMQRFDFVERRRVLTPDEASDLREQLGGQNPYHRAAAEAVKRLKALDS
jgi:HEAT repeat protein